MLTGHTPFPADTPGEVFALVLHTDPPPMGLGRDVELVVRRGLAKSNRQRFPAITDFADALRAAAAGRLRETQWAATLAYAAGEVASHNSKGRSGRRMRGLVLALGVLASILLAFVVGGEVNRRSSLDPAHAVPDRAGGGHPRGRGCPRRRAGGGIARRAGAQRNRATPTKARRNLGRSQTSRPPSRRPPASRRRQRAASGRAIRAGSPRPRAPSARASPCPVGGRRRDAARHRAVELNGRVIHFD